LAVFAQAAAASAKARTPANLAPRTAPTTMFVIPVPPLVASLPDMPQV
jgi:hypothetical protein